MVIAQLMFTVMNILSRIVGRDVPWSEVAGSRFLFGIPVVLLLARASGSSLRVIDRKNTWLRSIFGTAASVGFFYSVTSSRVPLGDVVTLGATGPILVALLSRPLLGERVGRHVGMVVLLAFAGVIGVARPTFETAADVVIMATSSAFFYSLALIWLRKIGPNESSEAIVLHFSIVAVVTMALVSIPLWVTPDARATIYLVGTGLTGGMGQVAMTRAYAFSSGAAPLSVFTYLSIVFTHLLAIPLFGEHVGAMQLAGAGAVILSGVLLAVDAWKTNREIVRPGLLPVGETVAED